MYKKIFFLFLVLFLFSFTYPWGFFAHREINRLAVFSLPPEMFGFYKKHIDELTLRAVAADQRRYSDPEEASRHFIDLEYYTELLPYDSLTLNWEKDKLTYGEDSILKHGNLPWNFKRRMNQLAYAFKEKNISRIIKLSADIGHYAGDAHVPLHTTRNYNGQLTGQHGIHAFWESRLPELFFDQYDVFMYHSIYIPDLDSALKRVIMESNLAVDTVLTAEREARKETPVSRQMEYGQRGTQFVPQASERLSSNYHEKMKGMVEKRLRESIYFTACCWHTAWVWAGKPNLDELIENTAIHFEEDTLTTNQKVHGRSCD